MKTVFELELIQTRGTRYPIRKAFNNLERANQLPNDDKTIARDLDVLRKLLRYSRNEIDQLRQTVNENPDNKVAKARLKELEERIQD